MREQGEDVDLHEGKLVGLGEPTRHHDAAAVRGRPRGRSPRDERQRVARVELEDVVRHPGRHVLHDAEPAASLLLHLERRRARRRSSSPSSARRQLVRVGPRGRCRARTRRSSRTTTRPPARFEATTAAASSPGQQASARPRSARGRRSRPRRRRSRRGRAGGRRGRPERDRPRRLFVDDLEQDALVLMRAARAHDRTQRAGDAALPPDHLADVLLARPAARSTIAPSRSARVDRTSSGLSTRPWPGR